MKMNNLLVFFSVLLVTPAFAEIVDKTVAIVNNEVILESDIRTLENNISKPGAIDEALLNGKKPEDLKNNRPLILDYLIFDKILASEIKRLGHTVTAERANQEFKDIAKRNNLDEGQLVASLKTQGINVEEYKTFIKNRIEKQGLLDGEIASKLRISDDEAFSAYMKTKPTAKGRIKEVSLSHIFFNPKKSGGPDGAAQRASVVLEKIKRGEKFESLAEQYSEDADFTAGGSFGVFKTGELSSEFESAISLLEVGKTSELVPSKRGIHILKLTAMKEIPDPDFEKEKEKIKASLLDAAFSKQFKAWLSRKKEEAFVRISP